MKWLQFILSHSIFVSICAVSMAWQTVQLRLLHHNLFMYGFIFFATLGSYNFYWLLSKVSFAKKSSIAGMLKKERTVFFILLLSAAGLLYCFSHASLSVEFIVTGILLTVIYAIPLLPITVMHFTRKAGILKTILLAFTWTYVTAFMPIQKTYMQLDAADSFVIGYRFLFMLLLCILFDSRDMAVDKIRGLRSLATVLKPGQLNKLVMIIFGVMFSSVFFYKDYSITYHQSVALQVSALALLTVYFYAAKKQTYLFYYFMVDGLMLFSALATTIAGI